MVRLRLYGCMDQRTEIRTRNINEKFNRNDFGYYFENNDVKERGYFAIKDERKYPDNLMIFVPDVAEYVFASGGLSEFDYET